MNGSDFIYQSFQIESQSQIPLFRKLVQQNLFE